MAHQHLVPRPQALNWLIRHKDQHIIKVITGIRRCGKSTLLSLYRDWLLAQGVPAKRIVCLALEDAGCSHLQDYQALHEHVCSCLVEGEMTYVLLDEIRAVEQFERAAASLLLRENCDLYLTVSGTTLMDGELATLLTGRCLPFAMTPLSFAEFGTGLTFFPDLAREHYPGAGQEAALCLQDMLALYLAYGGFPQVLRSATPEQARCLQDIFASVLFNDVLKHCPIRDASLLEAVARFVLEHVGCRLSSKKIADALTEGRRTDRRPGSGPVTCPRAGTDQAPGRRIEHRTVTRCLDGLVASGLICEVERYDIRGQYRLHAAARYYAGDVGLISLVHSSAASEQVLENLVYLALRRQGYTVYVGQLGRKDRVDFVACKGPERAYYQVALTTLSQDLLEQELAPLRKIRDNYPKYLLTLDQVFADMDYQGIRKKNIAHWLLETEGSAKDAPGAGAFDR